ncbi:MAG: hypothetical protein AAFP76_15840, partial [Bacteroidota bacterium]
MKQLLFVVFLLSTTLSMAQEAQEIYQRAKIHYNSKEDLRKLSSIGIALDHGIHKKNHFFISEFSVSEIAQARQNGFEVEVLIENAKEFFLEQNRRNLPVKQYNPSCNGNGNTYETPNNFSLGSMGGY